MPVLGWSLFAASALLSSAPRPALAQDLCSAQTQQSGVLRDLNARLKSIDDTFRQLVVNPLASAIFLDVWFWDDSSADIKKRAVRAGFSEEQAEWLVTYQQRAVRQHQARGLSPKAAAKAARYELDPRKAFCNQQALEDGDCRALLLADTGKTAAETACGLGLPSESVRRFVALDSDPDAAFCESQGLAPGVCADIKKGVDIPIIVMWLTAGALFFTLRFRFINLRAFIHAIAVTRGRYDKPGALGEVSHFQALSSALSATVGLGNIAGVAIAVGVGGPGAVFWMILAGFLGMSSKFAECALGQLYRTVDDAGRVLGGPMRYLNFGLKEVGGIAAKLGPFFSGFFALLCVGGSLGGGNMFQANQSAAQIGVVIPFFQSDAGRVVYGISLAVLVGLVILGGIRRIGRVAAFLVPVMCAVYLLAGSFILVLNAAKIPAAAMAIINGAFSPEAGLGGFVGVLVMGFRRAAFSNEAGIGSASIAHSAAATDEPIREGIVALLEPFIDTIIVCTMTALVVVITGAYEQVDAYNQPLEGIRMTSWAFEQQLTGFSKVLSLAAFAFAISTMISWSYYGERAFSYLFGGHSRYASVAYRLLFLLTAILGSILELSSVLDFSDLVILGMAFPNILGAALLSGKLNRELSKYLRRLKNGEFQKQW